METKPGIQTSEFWITVVALVLAALASFGVIGGNEVEEIKGLIDPLIVALIPVVVYIWGRVKVKTAQG